ncbi:MAG: adenylate/guanylate cyclase domain-containing protein [Cereibacter sphaeroides]|uniref:Adenylate/guanylate cyclase domain-containing protein n=1 Tax=Cereibacter sphaeroides TaxID=1063 RepID=A0A2W5SBA9_CERSP|nr:MAG: adenylate/guanylate cyclase domain-containing protein [Cereibacter sphaeroides]
MAQDETGILARLDDRRKSVLAPIVRANGGRIVKILGDGVLVEFGSAVKAVEAALALQSGFALANEGIPPDLQIWLRIGINLGDVIGAGSDIYGDGVNIAARLEVLAEPGGICVSDKIYQEVKGKLDAGFADLGEQSLKNIPFPVRVYKTIPAAQQPALSRPVLSDRASIAVLPFDNMSGDPDQEYFADGMVEEIITALSRFRTLSVIARNSSFTYKGRAVDVKQVGRELGVRYVLEGSVRKSGNRVRITGQLIDAATGAHLWADRIDGALEDVFTLQDQVTTSVVGALQLRIEAAEVERSRQKPTDSLDAYDYFLRGLSAMHLWRPEANAEAMAHFQHCVELDPRFATAYGLKARLYCQRKASGWVTDPDADIAEARRLARLAATLGQDDALALASAGMTLAFVVGEHEESATLGDRAHNLNPNHAMVLYLSAWTALYVGDIKNAIRRFEAAIAISPNDPQIWMMLDGLGAAHLIINDIEEALRLSKSSLRHRPDFLLCQFVAAGCSALLGRHDDAHAHVATILRDNPKVSAAQLAGMFPEFRNTEDFARFHNALVAAGLPA